MPMLSANSCQRSAPAPINDRRLYLCDCVLDGTLICHIALVTDQQLVDTLCGVSVDLLQPLLYVVE